MRGCRKGSNVPRWLETNVEDWECFQGNVNPFKSVVRSQWSWHMLFPLLVFSKGRESVILGYFWWCIYSKNKCSVTFAQQLTMLKKTLFFYNIFPILLSFLLRLFFMSLSHTVTNGSSHSPTALNGAPSPPNGYSNGPSSSSSSSLANQQLPPACGARQLSKLKRFLTTLQQFGNDISPEIGERVRTLVLGLVVSGYCVCEL